MPARKPREIKSAAPSPSPGPSRASARSRSKLSEETVPEVSVEVDEADENGVEASTEDDEAAGQEGEAESAEAEAEASGASSSGKLSMVERMQKLKDLRMRMNASSAANRKDLIADHQKAKVTAKEVARLEKQRKLAQTLRLKADAEETGEDLERKKAWEWSIEQNERWEAKMAEQAIKADTAFHNAEDEAHKKYNRDLRATKPDLLGYERQKEAALGLTPGTLVPAGATSETLAVAGPSRVSQGLTAHEDLYRGMDTLAYGDSKPSEDAVDRVVGKINKDKNKRKKKEDEDEVVTYINERNKVFNKKIARYYDKYTKDFERGTAL